MLFSTNQPGWHLIKFDQSLFSRSGSEHKKWRKQWSPCRCSFPFSLPRPMRPNLPFPFPFNAYQPIFLLITPTFFRFIDVTSNVYIKKGKKKELLYRQESCYDLLFIDYCYSLFWKDLLISFHSKTDVENDIEIRMTMLLFDDMKFIIEIKFFNSALHCWRKKRNRN